ncbi:hypothetical protein MCGFDL_MCGFDL_00250, partial [Dysosmobacter welbionis]
AAAGPVADHRMTQLDGYRHAQAVVPQPVFPAVKHHPSAHGGGALLVQPAE